MKAIMKRWRHECLPNSGTDPFTTRPAHTLQQQFDSSSLFNSIFPQPLQQDVHPVQPGVGSVWRAGNGAGNHWSIGELREARAHGERPDRMLNAQGMLDRKHRRALDEEQHSEAPERQAGPQIDPDNCIDVQVHSFAGLGNSGGHVKDHLGRSITQPIIELYFSLDSCGQLVAGMRAGEECKTRLNSPIGLPLVIGARQDDAPMLVLEVKREG